MTVSRIDHHGIHTGFDKSGSPMRHAPEMPDATPAEPEPAPGSADVPPFDHASYECIRDRAALEDVE